MVGPELALLMGAHAAEGEPAGAGVHRLLQAGVARRVERVVLEIEHHAVARAWQVVREGAGDGAAVRAEEIGELHHPDGRLGGALGRRRLQIDRLHRPLVELAGGLLGHVLVELLRIVEDLLEPARLLLRGLRLFLVALGLAARCERRARVGCGRRQAAQDRGRLGALLREGQGAVGREHRRDQGERPRHPAREGDASFAAAPGLSQHRAIATGAEQQQEGRGVHRIGEETELAERLDDEELHEEEADVAQERQAEDEQRLRGRGVACARAGQEREEEQEGQGEAEHEAPGGEGNAEGHRPGAARDGGATALRTRAAYLLDHGHGATAAVVLQQQKTGDPRR